MTTCNAYIKISKQAAGYEPSRGYRFAKRCGICDHFYLGTTALNVGVPVLMGQCDLVMGSIAPMGWCKLYSPEVLPGDISSKHERKELA